MSIITRTLTTTTTVLSVSQVSLSDVATTATATIVGAALTLMTTSTSASVTSSGSASSLALPLLSILGRLNVQRARNGGGGSSGGRRRRLVLSSGADVDMGAWVHSSVDSLGRAVADALVPGGPASVVSTGSTTDGSALSVRVAERLLSQ